ncbi:MAG: hypothetical protein K1Y36_12410 [Blastocatellia bacterium]|nr:hypothetical protein [Blastocatellia bacterium]
MAEPTISFVSNRWHVFGSILLCLWGGVFSACTSASAPTTQPSPASNATPPATSKSEPAADPTAPVVVSEHLEPTTDQKALWMPIKVEQECKTETTTIPVGDYQICPIIETVDGKKEVTKYILAKKSGIALADIDTKNAKAPDGSFAVVINVLGVATLKDKFAASRPRFSANEQIASIWVGLAGGNREWTSEPLKLTNPKPLPKKK